MNRAGKRSNSSAPFSRFIALLSLAMAVLAPCGELPAATPCTWNGSVSASMANQGNWANNTTPNTQAYVANFPSGTQARQPLQDMTAAIGRIHFTGSTGWTIGQSGASLLTIMGDDGTGSVAVWNNHSSGANMIGCNIALGRSGLEWKVDSGSALVMSGILSGSGMDLVKTGGGVLTLSGINAYTGATFINSGMLEATTASCFNVASPSSITLAAGATLFMNYSGSANWSSDVNGAGLWLVATGTGSQSAVLGGDYSAFTGTLAAATGNAKIVLTTPARYPSTSATLQLGPGTAAYISGGGAFVSAIRMYGGVTGEALGQLRFGNNSSGSASGSITLFADTTIGVDSGKARTISGAIGGSFGFTKLSGGTLTLTGANTYTGDTTVSGGALIVNGSLGQADSVVTVTGGTGTLGGQGVIRSRVQALSDGALAPGSGGVGALTINNDLTLAGQTIMEVNMPAGANDKVVCAGKITYGGVLVVTNLASAFHMGDCFTLFQAASYAGSFSSISPATPGSGLVWDTSSLARDGTLLVMGSSVETDTYTYGGYTIKARSRFNAYNSLVNRAYPLYDYSVNLLKIGSSYMAVTGDRYTGSGEDGDHIFGWTSAAGQPSTWTNIKGSSSASPLFLQSDSFNANTMDPELIYNPANKLWYLYVQKQSSSGDRIMALTSTDRKNWTAHTSRSVITNIPSNAFFHHEEVIYVPWSSKPFWLYVDVRLSGVEKAYKLIKSADPLTFDYDTQVDSGGERNTGGQRGYLQEAKSGPLFIRITSVASGSKDVPGIQFSDDGVSWTYSGWVTLDGSSNTGNYGNCYFPGISTINGNGGLEYLGHNRWRAIYAATTCASPTQPEIWYSEIGCGEVVIELNTAPTISNVGDKTTDEDTATSPIAFTVGDYETTAGALTVTGKSSNTTLVPNANIIFGGSGANRTVTITPAADKNGSATITLTVSDGALTDTDTFVLTVVAVNDAPTISNVANQWAPMDTAAGPLAFTINDVETPATSLTLTGSSSNTTLVPDANIVFGGSGANRTVTVTPATSQTGTATITLTVSDGALAASDTFILSVRSASDRSPGQTWKLY
ncbi:MAG: autotransporter-associated beta strand repeat-containing protein [Candidatus Sumerlaeota bacterium]|nr:autotransporter-associated beta strand repeat-containing protein [Candidatus Sumerlaeota bacterium]